MKMEYQHLLVKSTQTVNCALEIIEEAKLKIALVVDDDYRLVGTITDGDIRRALLRNANLATPVTEAMNVNPITAEFGAPRSVLIDIMEKNNVSSIPLLEDGILVGLDEIETLTDPALIPNPVFLMAGGFGTRLRPLTDNCPKPLLRIDGVPILEIMLRRFIKAGFFNFYISTHYLPEMIKNHFGDGSDWNINISYVHEESPLGTGGAIGLLPYDLPDLPLIMMNGDIVTNLDFRKLLACHNSQSAAATMCVRDYEMQVPYGVVESCDGKVTGMVEKPIHSFFINAGIYVVNQSVRRSLEKDTIIDMPTILARYIDKESDLRIFPVDDYWIDIGRKEDYERGKIEFNQLGFV